MAPAELHGVVALDGPSGTGKSTVARGTAVRLGAAYLDTGAMYRAMTLAVLRAGVELSDGAGIMAVVRALTLTMGTDPAGHAVLLDGVDVAEEIRGPEVTGAVSAVSAVPEVRELLVAQQRRLIAEARNGIVVEGRDIGTIVAPEAGLKVYLTASAAARAERRTVQDAAAGRVSDVTATKADVERRDAFDSGRAISPLRAAQDAVEVETTELDVAGVLDRVEQLIAERGLLGATERTAR